MSLNWFVVGVAALQAGAGVYSLIYTDWKFGVMWGGLAIANTMMVFIERG